MNYLELIAPARLSRSNRRAATGGLVLVGLASLVAGCAAKPDPVVIPDQAKAAASKPLVIVNAVSIPNNKSIQPKTAEQALNDPNVPPAAKALIKAHMH